MSPAGGGGLHQQAGGGCFAHWKQRLEIVSCLLPPVFYILVSPPPPQPPPKGSKKGRLHYFLDTDPPISRGQAFAGMTIPSHASRSGHNTLTKRREAHTTNPPVHPEPVEACPEPVEGGRRGWPASAGRGWTYRRCKKLKQHRARLT